MQTKTYDVIVVGAGFSGMSCALALRDSNIHNILILEARDRLGGRVVNEQVALDNGQTTRWDCGGAYIGPHQNRLLSLIKRFNLDKQTYKVYTQGKNITQYNDEPPIHYDGLIPKQYTIDHFLSLLDFNHIIRTMDKLASKIDLTDPINKSQFTKQELRYYNSITIDKWVDTIITNCKAKDSFLSAVCGDYCMSGDDISVLTLLIGCKACHSFMNVIENDGGAQDGKLKGFGTYGLLLEIEKYLLKSGRGAGVDIILNNFVSSIKFNENKNAFIVEADIKQKEKSIQNTTIATNSQNVSYLAKYVVVTVPLNLYHTINFIPKSLISNPRRNMINGQKCGYVIKCNVFYKTPFWRKDGFTGMIFNNGNKWDNDMNELIVLSYDDCNLDTNIASLVGFIVGKKAIFESTKLSVKDKMQRKNKILKQYAKMFNNDKRFISECIGYVERHWTNESEPLTGGGYGPVPVISQCPTKIKNVNFKDADSKDIDDVDLNIHKMQTKITDNNRLFFAGSEMATRFASYIEGAIESGQRCAFSIATEMKKQGENVKVMQDFVENVQRPKDFEKNKVIEKHIELSWVERYCVPSAYQCKLIVCVMFVIVAAVAWQVILYFRSKNSVVG